MRRPRGADDFGRYQGFIMSRLSGLPRRRSSDSLDYVCILTSSDLASFRNPVMLLLLESVRLLRDSHPGCNEVGQTSHQRLEDRSLAFPASTPN
jgi:hypothetical protein